MNELPEIHGDYEVLDELKKSLNEAGVESDVWTLQCFAVDGPTGHMLKIAGAYAAGVVTPILVAYITAKSQGRKIVVEKDGQRIEIEGRSVEEVRELLATAQTVFMKKQSKGK